MPNHKFSRREFARRAAVASAATLVPANLAPAPVAPAPPQQPPNLPKLSPESQAEADARTQSVLAQYGSRLSDEQKSEIARLSVVAQRQLDRLRAFPVENADDPALYLKPLMEREKKPASLNPAAAATKPAPAAKPAPSAPKN
jgi:hypothetical protein